MTSEMVGAGRYLTHSNEPFVVGVVSLGSDCIDCSSNCMKRGAAMKFVMSMNYSQMKYSVGHKLGILRKLQILVGNFHVGFG